MSYKYEYKIESTEYMGAFSYGEFVSPTKLNSWDVEMAIVESKGYEEIMEELHDVVDDIYGRDMETEIDGTEPEYAFSISIGSPIEVE